MREFAHKFRTIIGTLPFLLGMMALGLFVGLPSAIIMSGKSLFHSIRPSTLITILISVVFGILAGIALGEKPPLDWQKWGVFANWATVLMMIVVAWIGATLPHRLAREEKKERIRNCVHEIYLELFWYNFVLSKALGIPCDHYVPEYQTYYAFPSAQAKIKIVDKAFSRHKKQIKEFSPSLAISLGEVYSRMTTWAHVSEGEIFEFNDDGNVELVKKIPKEDEIRLRDSRELQYRIEVLIKYLRREFSIPKEVWSKSHIGMPWNNQIYQEPSIYD